MQSDYEHISKDNIRRRGEDFDDIGHFLAEQLYTDRLHFIYELLQNAEDALGRRFNNNSLSNEEIRSVKFNLFRDRLEFRHNGQPFNTEDVKGISDILKGTKSSDLNQIGKFGIGFKSVYAFTNGPEIHSGDEHFKIVRYIRPEETPIVKSFKEGETLFIFPFDNHQVSPSESFDIISKKLFQLGPRVLLFLKRINEIEFFIDDVRKGRYHRVVKVNHQRLTREIKLRGQNDTGYTEENWLVLSRDIELPKKEISANVELAFRLIEDQKSKKLFIIRSGESPLSVFFPTEKDTRLGFYIQGPYRTSPSRDNIPQEDEWNKMLLKETAFLISESLPLLRDMGLLNVGLLDALPIRQRDFPDESMFFPIFHSVQDVFSKCSLIPTSNGDYISAKQAKLASSSGLRNLLSHDRLTLICNSAIELKWVSSDITQDKTPEVREYFTGVLGIEEITPDSFSRKFSKEFIEKQSDLWMKGFYSFLSGQNALWREAQTTRYSRESEGPLRKKPFIRLDNNEHVPPFNMSGNPNAYLPSSQESAFPIVKRQIATDKSALEFLKMLGLTEVREKDEIESILELYYRVKSTESPSDDQHIHHIKKFIKWYQNEGDLAIFDDCYLFMDIDKYFSSPDVLYLDKPYKDTGLSELFDLTNKDDREKAPLWEGYLKIVGFTDFACALGVLVQLVIEQTKIDNNPDREELIRNSKRHTWTGVNEDYYIKDLCRLLDLKTIGVSQLVWKTMCGADPKVLKARYRPNQEALLRVAPSQLSHALMGKSWIPDIHENFKKPEDSTEETLNEGLIFDDRNGWLKTIGFGKKAKKESEEHLALMGHAEALGIKNIESINLVKQLESDEELFFKVKSFIELERDKPEFPVRESHDPGRRAEKTAEKFMDAKDKTYELKQRSTRTSLNVIDQETWLLNRYKNNEEKMICQICQKEMPFKKRNGDYYFEAVEALSKNYFTKETESQFLALCPLCAAMYKEFVKRDEEAMLQLKQMILNSKDHEYIVPIKLGSLSTFIRFVEIHYVELKAIIRKSSEGSDR
jgi:hypothetical protein